MTDRRRAGISALRSGLGSRPALPDCFLQLHHHRGVSISRETNISPGRFTSTTTIHSKFNLAQGVLLPEVRPTPSFFFFCPFSTPESQYSCSRLVATFTNISQHYLSFETTLQARTSDCPCLQFIPINIQTPIAIESKYTAQDIAAQLSTCVA